MRTLLASTLVGALFSFAAAADAQQAPNAQQDRMKSCNSQAQSQNLSGDARKSFMSDCLSGKGTSGSSTSPTSQQQKMQSCNTTATSQKLTGDSRKQFMSNCLKGQ